MLKLHLRYLVYLVLAAAFCTAKAGANEDFFRAVKVDNARTVSALLGDGLNPNTTDESGQVALYLAMRDASPQVAAVLLAHPAIRLDAVNAAGETPLMMAALRGRLEWVSRLIDGGGLVNRAGWSPLHYAASGPEPRAVALLLERGAHVDAPSPNRSTALMMAARYGDEASAQLLIARGADAKARNDKGLNAADFARPGGREALAARLDALAR